jgi:alpha-ketoglutarate-dependent taurine dioxygenase
MEREFPYLVEAHNERDLCSWIEANRDTIHKQTSTCGALLLRGFAVENETDFSKVVRSLSGEALDYVYRSTPRTAVGDGVYTATEYPAGVPIPQHNENAYQRDWPMRLIFFCMQPATGGGGETPLADIRKITSRIRQSIRDKFYSKRVMYVRNYRADLDLPWSTVFQTESKAEVEVYCRSHDIDYQWTSEDTLRTRQVCDALVSHPRTGDLLWFNQAHLFHPSNLGKKTRAFMSQTFAEEDFPRNSCYGDGSAFEETELDEIRDAFQQETVVFEWRAGDVLVLDNMLLSHGRTPYKGKRRVLAAMCDPYSARQAGGAAGVTAAQAP